MKKLTLFFISLTSFCFAIENLSIFEAVTRNEKDLINYMLNQGAEVNVTNADGMSPLHLAADRTVANALILNGANLDAQNIRGSAPLHWAVSRKKEEVAQLLLEYGANPNISDFNGNTPLHWAAEEGNDALILLLIRKGANVNLTNKNGNTPLFNALANGYIRSSQFLTMAGATEISNQEALAPSSFVSAVTTPDLVQVLEADFLDPLIRSIFRENYSEAVDRINNGANLTVVDINGNTALHWAFTKKNRFLSRLLLDKGADINAYNHKGQSPADLLKLVNDSEFEKYILGLAKDKIKKKS